MDYNNSFIFVKQSLSLSGTVCVEGAKNSILPLICVCLLTRGKSLLRNVPNSQDVHKMCDMLTTYNIYSSFCNKTKELTIDTSDMTFAIPTLEQFKNTRTSTLFVGPLLSQFKEAYIGLPGGDNIGKRPIDLHLDGFKTFGCSVKEEGNYIHIYNDDKKDIKKEFFLDYPSVGATQNILMYVATLEQETVLYNIAEEPEINDLIEVLRLMGADVQTYFGGTVRIKGSKNLKPFTYFIISDRLETGTLLIAAAITKGMINIPNAPAYAMQAFLKKLKDSGHHIIEGSFGVGVQLIAAEKAKAFSVKTMPYPGFPTDLQSPTMALLSVTEGRSVMHETVFESRMRHAYELNKMGARISVEYDLAHIDGVNQLYGTYVESSDIRACSALVLAGLVAKGVTKIYGLYHLLRGYEKLDEKLRSLGGDIFIGTEEEFYLQSKPVVTMDTGVRA